MLPQSEFWKEKPFPCPSGTPGAAEKRGCVPSRCKCWLHCPDYFANEKSLLEPPKSFLSEEAVCTTTLRACQLPLPGFTPSANRIYGCQQAPGTALGVWNATAHQMKGDTCPLACWDPGGGRGEGR